MTSPTTMPTFQLKAYAPTPATDRVRKISSGAYATEDSASLANTGSAIFLGSSVSPSRSLPRGRPTSRRLRMRPAIGTVSDARAWPPCSVLRVPQHASEVGLSALRDHGVRPRGLDPRPQPGGSGP